MQITAGGKQPVSPIRNAFEQIRVGTNVVQVATVLERCGWNKYRKPGLWLTGGRVPAPADAYCELCLFSGQGIETVSHHDTLTYQGASGETLTIRWEGPDDWEHMQRLIAERGTLSGRYTCGLPRPASPNEESPRTGAFSQRKPPKKPAANTTGLHRTEPIEILLAITINTEMP
jgi:hypothetical protein